MFILAFYVNGDNITSFDSFGVKHIPTGIKKCLGNKNIKINISRIRESDSIMCRYFCTGLIHAISKGKFVRLHQFIFTQQIW